MLFSKSAHDHKCSKRFAFASRSSNGPLCPLPKSACSNLCDRGQRTITFPLKKNTGGRIQVSMFKSDRVAETQESSATGPSKATRKALPAGRRPSLLAGETAKEMLFFPEIVTTLGFLLPMLTHCVPSSHAIAGKLVCQSHLTHSQRITTPPRFILPEGNGRGTDRPGITGGQHMTIKVFFGFSDYFAWMAQVHNDEVEALQSSRHSSRFLIDLDKRRRRKLTSFCGCRQLKGPAPLQAPNHRGCTYEAFHVQRAHDKAEALSSGQANCDSGKGFLALGSFFQFLEIVSSTTREKANLCLCKEHMLY